ncbi:MAG: tRNA-dihydrouridine synthase family protein [Candidatus Methanoperedens sp.]|nr:tRNA-dihydrouridine synthase family protein [Candidatus Methanoperedens sp.]MCZ7371724.1 tRNA-dihydrouridine synthase family protein [Candidatus Methanoperedens sp.]
MNIGKLRLNGCLLLAPMSGVTNLPMRLLCKKHGASLVYSEMACSEGIVRKNPKSIARGVTCMDERPFGIQLLGSSADALVRSASILQEIHMPELIDMNFGCPSQCVLRNGFGSALLKKPEEVEDIIKKLSGSLDVPVTAKIRVLNSHEETLKIARIIEKSGASAITVHGRTPKQQYSGKSNLEIIRKIKNELSIPVIANGDISDEKQAELVLKYTQCDGIMIGRAAIGNPYIFRRIAHYLDTGELLQPRTFGDQIGEFFEYAALCSKYDMMAYSDLKLKAQWFLKKRENIRSERKKINEAKDIDMILKIMSGLREESSG